MKYQSQVIANIWSRENQLALWAVIEAANAAHRGAPLEVVTGIANTDVPTPEDVDQLEMLSGGHEMVSFLTLFTASMPDEMACWVHRGLTTSDIVDTSVNVALGRTAEYLAFRLSMLIQNLDDLFNVPTPRVAWTHGRPASRTTLARQVDIITRRLTLVVTELLISKSGLSAMLSGPTGDSAPPRWEEDLNDPSGIADLGRVYSSGQALDRVDRMPWVSAMTTAATALESVAQFLWDGIQRDEFRFEGTTSSSMPHKSNPTQLERVWGLARLVRGLRVALDESAVMRGDRDISQSSVERVAYPQMSHLVAYSALELLECLDNIAVDSDVVASICRVYETETHSFSRLLNAMEGGMSYLDARDAAAGK